MGAAISVVTQCRDEIIDETKTPQYFGVSCMRAVWCYGGGVGRVDFGYFGNRAMVQKHYGALLHPF